MISFNNEKIRPDEQAVLREMGIKKISTPSPLVLTSLESAFERFDATSKPVGIFKNISLDDFDRLFHGEGMNEPDTPVFNIYKNSNFIALYAVTLGKTISELIDNLAKEHDYAGSFILNTIASIAADNASMLMSNIVKESNALPDKESLLGYSPGYCGWHLSGQKRVFEFLNPGQIGISLNGSFHMSPIKSVTGALIGGPGDIHIFKPDFSFCKMCRTMSCTGRFKEVKRSMKADS